jgi:hypothetical protein
MADVLLIRLVAVCGSFLSAVAYVAFAAVNTNGDRWWHANKFWAIIGLAPLHVLSAWTLFAMCGGAAYLFRHKLAHRPLLVTAVLIGFPTVWAVALRFLYYAEAGSWWPSFTDQEWRWLVSHIYAEFAFGLLVGFVGLAAFAMNRRPPRRPT